MQSTLQFAISVAFATCLVSTSAHAGLQALGHEFRPTDEQRGGGPTCTDSAGVTASVVRVCQNPYPGGGGCYDDNGGMLFANWRDAQGNHVTPAVLVSEYFRYSKYVCSSSGAILVLAEGESRVFHPTGPRGPWTQICDSEECAAYEAEAAGLPDGFLVVWQMFDPAIRGRWLDEDGAPVTEEIELVAQPADRPISTLALASDSLGRSVLAWVDRAIGETSKFARAVAIVDRTASASVVLNEFPGSELYWIEIVREDSGDFLASWENYETQAGYVARRIRIVDGATTTTTSSTTTTLDSDAPAFQPATSLGNGSVVSDPGLGNDGKGRWFAGWNGWARSGLGPIAASSSDDGWHWSVEVHPEGETSWRAPFISDGGDVAISSWSDGGDGSLFLRRTEDAGRTWLDRQTLVEPPYSPDRDDVAFDTWSSTLAKGAPGEWLVAWSEVYYERRFSPPSGWDRVYCPIRTSRSLDSGRTWSEARTVTTGVCDVYDLRLATNGNEWVAIWNDQETLAASHSTDDGESWSPPQTLVSGGTVALYSTSLAASPERGWLLAYVADDDRYEGGASRLVVSSASSAAGPWTEPVSVAPWHAEQSGFDSMPSVAAGEDGSWGIAWTTHAVFDGKGLDSDIVAAFSIDGGATWSRARTVDEEAVGDFTSDTHPTLVRSGKTWAVMWKSAGPGDGAPASVRFARTLGGCGDGQPDSGEACDDGNLVDGDGCDSSCTPTGCGNHVTTAGEQCDDGNADDGDRCLSSCRTASCGDGFVERVREECDDGNPSNADECTTECTFPFCGDGIVRDGVEDCDDGGSDNNDACLATCRSARCGDGFINLGVEECDDGNSRSADFCTRHCRIDRICELLPEWGAGGATAGDALRVLRKALGIPTRCPVRRCDKDGSGAVTASDALTTLRAAVGLPIINPGCRPVRAVRIRLVSPSLMDNLDLRLRYADAAGEVLTEGGKVRCRTIVDGGFALYGVDAALGVLTINLVSWNPFEGPVDLVRCEFTALAGSSPNDFQLTVDDAWLSFEGAVVPPPVIEVIPE